MNEKNDPKQLQEMISILERKLGILHDSEFSCCGITMAQCHALMEIGCRGSISLNELAEMLNLENSTMSRTVNNLVVNGFVKRDIDPQDRRYVTISLTESGRRLYEDLNEGMYEYYIKVYGSIPEGKRQQVMESIRILLDAIGRNGC